MAHRKKYTSSGGEILRTRKKKAQRKIKRQAGDTSWNYTGIHVSFKNLFSCHNDMKQHMNVDKFLST